MHKLMHLGNARVAEQRAQMEDLTRRGVCPFCRKNFEADHKAPILYENRFWLLSNNDYPYEGSRIHLLLVHKRHVQHLSEVTSLAFAALSPVMRWATKNLKLSGGGLVVRFGDMRYTGATVAHLHAHIVVGIREGRNTESIKVKLGYRRK